MPELELMFATPRMFRTMLFVIVIAAVDAAVLLIPMKLPEDVEDRFEMFCITLLSNVTGEVTVLMMAMPLTPVARAVVADRIRILLDVAPPTMLLFTGVGAVEPVIRIPVMVVGAGAEPTLVTSIPPT